MFSDLAYKIAFSSIRGMGYEFAQKVLNVLQSEQAFFDMTETELKDSLEARNSILKGDYRLNLLLNARKEEEFIRKNNIDITYFTDNDYPVRLSNAADAPILLYSKGDCNLNKSKIISIVGTRNLTNYGEHFCKTLIRDLKDKIEDLVIVSGLAYGADICAHKTALECDIPTVGVLAHGLNMIYPAMHRNTAVEMLNKGGLLLTEYTSQTVIHRANFLARNRIVAGLSDCTIVVESAEQGGAMVTADIASGYSRDVFALPGRTSDIYSVGCNKLIRNNVATLITSAEDLINSMQWDVVDNKQPHQTELFVELDETETKIVEFLRQKGEVNVNVITKALEIPMSKLLSKLIDLEYRGVLLSSPGNKYSLA